VKIDETNDTSRVSPGGRRHSHRSQRVATIDPGFRKLVVRPLPSQRSHRLLPTAIVPVIIILVALTVTVVGSFSWAYFSSTATTTASFSSGTVGLMICNEQGQDCQPSVVLPALTNTYPGWSHQVVLALRNDGTLRMKVFMECSEQTDAGLGGLVRVQICKPASQEWSCFWSGTFDELEAAQPIECGELSPEEYGPIMFSFQWPESGTTDAPALLQSSLIEQIVFTGTTQGVTQP
jgi:predicted ribosomally synthesized peptide with SipW-like signal peptide